MKCSTRNDTVRLATNGSGRTSNPFSTIVTHAMKNTAFTTKPRIITANDDAGAVAQARVTDTQESAVVTTGATTPSKTSNPPPVAAHSMPDATTIPIAHHNTRPFISVAEWT